MEGFGLFAFLGLVILGVVLVMAPLKLFSIDNKLREILAELRALRQNLAAAPPAAVTPRSSDDDELAAARAAWRAEHAE